MTRRTKIGYVAGAVLVSFGAVGARALAPSPATRITQTSADPRAAQQTPMRERPRPAYLPDGVTLAAEGERDGVWVQRYAIAGTANQDQMPADIASYDGVSEAHPATTIDLLQTTQVPSMLGPVDGSLYEETEETIGDAAARVVTPKSGYGTYRVAWQTDGVAFLITSRRLRTVTQGTSGLPVEELLLMARSVA